MRNPRVDDLGRHIVVLERFDQDLTPPIELPTEDTVRAVRLVERSPVVFHGSAKMLCSMLILEALDAFPLGACEQKADHRVVKTAIDEIVDDGPQRRLAAELFKQTHLVRDPEPMSISDQAASGWQHWPRGEKWELLKKSRTKEAAWSKHRSLP